MSKVRGEIWSRRMGKKSDEGSRAKSLPPSKEAFEENVKRAHIQTAIWKSAPNSEPPALDPVQFGWERDENSKSRCLIPVTLQPNVSVAPPEVLVMIRCACATIIPCSTECVDAIQLTYLVQYFVEVTGKHTARMSTPDRLMTVRTLQKVTCLKTGSNQWCHHASVSKGDALYGEPVITLSLCGARNFANPHLQLWEFLFGKSSVESFSQTAIVDLNKNGGPYLDYLQKISLSSTFEFLNLIVNSRNMHRRQDNRDTVCSYWDMDENRFSIMSASICLFSRK